MTNAIITSAIALTKVQKETIEKAIEKENKKVVFEYVVDPKVIGGLSISIGSKLWDATVKTQLTSIKEALSTSY